MVRTVRVQFPSPAPSNRNPNPKPIGKGFGFFLFQETVCSVMRDVNLMLPTSCPKPVNALPNFKLLKQTHYAFDSCASLCLDFIKSSGKENSQSWKSKNHVALSYSPVSKERYDI